MYIFSNYHLNLSHLLFKFTILFFQNKEYYRTKYIDKIENLWSDSKNYLTVCYSCRSAFDLLLNSLHFEPGSEIIFTALTIRNMVNFAEYYGLKVLPWDIDISTTYPKLDQLERLLSPQTRVVVITHLFGIKIPNEIMSLIVNKIRAYNSNIIIVEDLAQCFYELKDNKHQQTDVALYSFGTSKTFTAIKGGVLETNNCKLNLKIKEKLQQFPVISRSQTFKDLLTTSLGLFLSLPLIMGITSQILKWIGSDFETFIKKYFTAYPTKLNKEGKEDFEQIVRKVRFQPSIATLALLTKRLENLSSSIDQPLQDKQKRGRYACKLLKQIPEVIVPGGQIENRNYWIFSVYFVSPNSNLFRLKEKLVQSGFGVSFTATTFGCVDQFVTDKTSSRYISPREAVSYINNVLYLPIISNIPENKIQEMVHIIQQHVH